MDLLALTSLPIVEREAGSGADALALARALVGVLREVLDDLLSDASPEREVLIRTLFKLTEESKKMLLEARREFLAGSSDTSTFRRKIEWPLYEQIARLLVERSTAFEKQPVNDTIAKAELATPATIRRYFLGYMLLYDSAFHDLLYPPAKEGEFLFPPSPSGTPLTIFTLFLHSHVLNNWSQIVRTRARGAMEEDDVFSILNDLLHGATPFSQFDQSLLRNVLVVQSGGEVAPFQTFLEDTNRGEALVSKWNEWLSSCHCAKSQDRAHCSVHVHYALCKDFIMECFISERRR